MSWKTCKAHLRRTINTAYELCRRQRHRSIQEQHLALMRRMFPSSGSYQHGPPLLLRLREPPVTRTPRSYAALRLPAHLRSQLRFPSPSTYLFGECFFLAGPCEHPLPRSRWRLVTGSPYHRSFSEEWTGPPRLLGRPLGARPGHPPRQVCHSLAHLTVMALLPSENLDS